MKNFILFTICCQISLNVALKFPNDIKGSPTIDCGRDAITINVNTSNGLASRIFAKNQHENNKCSFQSVNSATFVLSECGMNRQRQLEPRGLSYNLIVVVQLHPMFITNVDKAYNLKCFYMEAAKIVTAGLEVSMLQTDTISSGTEAATGVGIMPQCNYTLRLDSPSGALVRYAKVGDKVWHLWECTTDTYGILVHSCFVTDGQGNEFNVIDQNGCGIDQYVLRTPEYSVTLNKAQQEVHVFKFADKMVVLFNCQIKLCLKANDGCKGITPPDCSNVTAPVTGERLVITTHKPSQEIPKPRNETENKPTNETENKPGNETENKPTNETSTGNEKPEGLAKGNATTESSGKNQTGLGENMDHEPIMQPTKGNQSENVEKSSNETMKPSEHPMNVSSENVLMEKPHESSMNKSEPGKAETEEMKPNATKTSENETRSLEIIFASVVMKNVTGVISFNESKEEVSNKSNAAPTNVAASEKETMYVDEKEKEKVVKFQRFSNRNETTNDTRERRNADKETRAEKLKRIMMDSVNQQEELETDVAQRIWVLEPEETSPLDNFGSNTFATGEGNNEELEDNDEDHRKDVCISTSKFNLVIGCLVFSLFLSSVFVISFLILLNRKRTSSSIVDAVRPPTRSSYKS